LVAAAKFLVAATKNYLLSLILLPKQNLFFREEETARSTKILTVNGFYRSLKTLIEDLKLIPQKRSLMHIILERNYGGLLDKSSIHSKFLRLHFEPFGSTPTTLGRAER